MENFVDIFKKDFRIIEINIKIVKPKMILKFLTAFFEKSKFL